MPFPPYPSIDTSCFADLAIIQNMIEVIYPGFINAGDTGGYTSMYMSDAVWSAPDMPDRRGALQIGLGFSASNFVRALVHVDDLDVIGDRAFVSALERVSSALQGTDAQATHYHRSLWLLRKHQGHWRIQRKIWTHKPSNLLREFFICLEDQRLMDAAVEEMP
jgi:ketosteroid isomerase-like protein